MSESERLRDALIEAQRYLGELPSPPNEANTCDWIVRPLLLALGYLNHEIHAQSGDVANKFPDYTILPSSDHTWYLEAKAWSVGLDSMHVDQALNYAHSNGKRWVVLTNGREWRLYDDRIPGKSADRLVATARLDDSDGLTKFLRAVSRESIQAEGVAAYAGEKRVRDFLINAIATPSSAIVQAILKLTRQSIGGVPVTAEAIVDVLNARQTAELPVRQPSPQPEAPAAPPPSGHAANSGPFFIRKGVLYAEGEYRNGNFLVRQGARVAVQPVPSYAPAFDSKRKPLADAGALAHRDDHVELLKDWEFGSPSGASDFVLGASSNGWKCWVDSKGKTLDEIIQRSPSEKWRVGMTLDKGK